MKILRFYDSRRLHAYLMLLDGRKLAEVTEAKNEHGFTYWLVQVSDPSHSPALTLADAKANLSKLRENPKGCTQ